MLITATFTDNLLKHSFCRLRWPNVPRFMNEIGFKNLEPDVNIFLNILLDIHDRFLPRLWIGSQPSFMIIHVVKKFRRVRSPITDHIFWQHRWSQMRQQRFTNKSLIYKHCEIPSITKTIGKMYRCFTCASCDCTNLKVLFWRNDKNGKCLTTKSFENVNTTNFETILKNHFLRKMPCEKIEM